MFEEVKNVAGDTLSSRTENFEPLNFWQPDKIGFKLWGTDNER